MTELTTKEVIKPNSYVGFDTITTQIEDRLIKRGFRLNLMLVGHSGLGKTTLVNTLFASHLVDSSGRKSAMEPAERTCEIQTVTHSLSENNVDLTLSIIDTPGYGDQINNQKCWDPLVKYIKEQHSQYLRRELTAARAKFIPDTRVHCVLFFLQPNGHGMTPLDITVMKKLTEIVNVVPIIAKSDSFTLEERVNFKKTIQKQLAYHNIRIYPFEYDTDDQTEEEIHVNETLRQIIPFATIGAENQITLPNGKITRGRKTRWGSIDVEDPTHCDFIYLRDFLTRTHLQDLIETTSLVHYEAFRSKQLLALKENGTRDVKGKPQHQKPQHDAAHKRQV